MIKSLIPTLSKEVGRSTALVFQQLMQWFKTNDVVYRTNQEIVDDLEGILSVTTVQRAKQKLVEAGYLVVSFEKGYKRTTHYRLTEKAKSFLETLKVEVAKKVESVKKAVRSVLPKSAPKVHTKPKENTGLAETKGMKEAFESYGKAPENKQPMPAELAALGRFSGRKKTAPVEGTVSNGLNLAGVFKSGVSDAQKKLFNLKNTASEFLEDY